MNQAQAASFLDGGNRTWAIELDAYAITDLRKETGVDLADLTAAGWLSVQTDVCKLVDVLAVLLHEQLSSANIGKREFSRGLKGEHLTQAQAALECAGADFFPPVTWSLMLSNLETRMKNQNAIQSAEEFSEVWDKVQPLMAVIDKMPPDMKRGAMAELKTQIEDAGGTSTDLENLQTLMSAGTPDSPPSNAAIDSPENAELTAVG